MNALDTILERARARCGFLVQPEITQLAELDRLRPVLVRCGGARFTCAAQDFANMERAINAGGDYIRDVSLPTSDPIWREDWKPEPEKSAYRDAWHQALPNVPKAAPAPTVTRETHPECCFNPDDCGGVWDGYGVTSDADPGL